MKRFFYTLLGFIFLIIIWYILVFIAQIFSDNYIYTMITPIKSFGSLLVMLGEKSFYGHILSSLYRILYALTLAIVIAIPLGIAYAKIEILRAMFYGPFQFLRMISPLSWMPLSVLFFDTWDASIVFLLTMATIWPIVFNINQGFGKINIGWIYVAKSFDANLFKQFRFTILPAISQDLITGLRISLGVSWVIIVPAEYLGVTSGLGYAINDARDTLDYSKLVALIISIGTIGFFIDYILSILSDKFIWK